MSDTQKSPDENPNENQCEFLGGRLLIATPAMGDPRFHRAVILMCDHAPDQAFGIVINKPLGKPRLPQLLAQLDLPGADGVADAPVLSGGPVDTQRGFVIHSADYIEEGSSIRATPDINVTPTKGVLEAMASDTPPARAVLALGYAGWGAGQLDREMMDNAWLVCPITDALVFETDADDVWTRALGSIGVKPEMLSSIAGHA